MKIGNYKVDNKLFEMYVRSIIGIRAGQIELEDERWKIHCLILQSIGLEHRFAVYGGRPSKLQTPTRVGRTWERTRSGIECPEVTKFDNALSTEVELFLKDY